MAVWSVVPVAELSPDIRWDAEHYRPEYIAQSKQIAKRTTKPLNEVADVSDGNHLSIAEDFSDEGVRYLRGQDLKDIFISDVDPVYIPESVYASLRRSHMFPGDVLVGIVGTIGTIGLVTERHGRLTGNCKLAIVRPRSLPGEYIAAYLSSRLGQYEISRRIRGAVQMGLILPDLKTIPIIAPAEKQLRAVVDAVRGARESRRKCAEITLAAEMRLIEALGMDRLDLSPQKSYARRFKDLQNESRFDAEYFNPKYQKVIAKLREGGLTLADVAPIAQRGFDPKKRTKGSSFDYIEIGLLTGDGEADAERLDVADAPSRAKWIVKPGDIITSTVRPIRKLSAMIRLEQDNYVCSSGFAVLTPKPNADGIESEVLLTYLRLPIICELLDLNCTASMYPTISEDRLMRMPFIKPDKETRTVIVEKVQDAISARREAARLLEQAKRTVEGLIAGGGEGKGR